MSARNAEIELDFGGEARQFRLGVGQLRRVQEKCDAGPGELAARLAPYVVLSEERSQAIEAGKSPPSMILAIATGRLGSWRVDDVREPIFQGLIGAGTSPDAATKIVRQWVDERPLIESLTTAFSILMASIAGVADELPAGER